MSSSLVRLIAWFVTISMGVCVSAESGVRAQAKANPLGDCFVAKSTINDRKLLAKWGLYVMGKELLSISDAESEKADRDVASIYLRLLSKECAKETKAAYSNPDFMDVFHIAISQFSWVVVSEITSSPEWKQRVMGPMKYVDEATLKRIGIE